MKYKIIIILIALAIPYHAFADFVFLKDANLRISVQANEAEVVHTAIDLFSRDYNAVFNGKVIKTGKAQLFIGTYGMGSTAEKMFDQNTIKALTSHPEGYALEVKNDQLIIL